MTYAMMRQTKGPVALAVAALAAFAFAGCIGDEASQDADAPVAALEVDQEDDRAPATVTFDATNSTDRNGEISEIRFDFGDGETMTVTDPEQARVEHAYDRGGAFNASVQVFDDGEGQDKILTDSAGAMVYLDEEFDLAVQPATAGPLANQTDTASWPFAVYEGAQRFEANLTVENTAAIGSSEATVQILDASGEVILEESVSLAEGESQDLDMTGLLAGDGDHEIRIVADSGSVSASGDVLVVYQA